MELPPYLYSDEENASRRAADSAILGRRRKQFALALIAVALACGAAGAALDHWISSGDSKSSPSAAATSTSSSADRRIYAVKEAVEVDGWEVVVHGYRVAARSGGQNAPPGWNWLLVDADITNLGAETRQLSPEILEVRYQLLTEGYAIKAPDRGIAPLDQIAGRQTTRRTLSYAIPGRANGFVVLFRAGVSSEAARGRAAEINLSCC